MCAERFTNSSAGCAMLGKICGSHSMRTTSPKQPRHGNCVETPDNNLKCVHAAARPAWLLPGCPQGYTYAAHCDVLDTACMDHDRQVVCPAVPQHPRNDNGTAGRTFARGTCLTHNDKTMCAIGQRPFCLHTPAFA